MSRIRTPLKLVKCTFVVLFDTWLYATVTASSPETSTLSHIIFPFTKKVKWILFLWWNLTPKTISPWWLKAITKLIGPQISSSWYLVSLGHQERGEKKNWDFQNRFMTRQCDKCVKWLWMRGKKRKSRKETYAKFYNFIINRYYFYFGGSGGGGSGGGHVMMVVVVCNDWRLDDRCLLVLLPVPHQQHGVVLAEVLMDGGNYKDEMTRECFSILLAFH